LSTIVLAIKCIGEDGDIKNVSGKGRLWKGIDKDRLFYHTVLLDKWNNHMKKLGYPFLDDTLGTLKYGVRVKGSSNGMCVPMNSAIAIIMEVWEARGRYSTADEDLKTFFMDPTVTAQGDTPKSVTLHLKPPPLTKRKTTPDQDLPNDATPTRLDVDQSASTPNTQNPKIRNISNVKFRQGNEIDGEDLTWVVIASVYNHSIDKFVTHGTINSIPHFDENIQENVSGALLDLNVRLWKEFLEADTKKRQQIMKTFEIMSHRNPFEKQDLTDRTRAVVNWH
jgi:hypothetical protein